MKKNKHISNICLVSSIFLITLLCSSALLAQVKQAEVKQAEKSGAKVEQKKADEEQKKRENEKKKAEYIEETLKYGVQKERSDAITRIHLIEDQGLRQKLYDLLIQLINDENDMDLLVIAINTAGELNVQAAVPSLIRKLDNLSEEVKVAAVYALKKLKATQAKEQLVQLLKSQDLTKASNFTEALIDTLSDFTATELADFAIQAIGKSDTSRGNRQLLVLFLGRVESAAGKELLCKVYKDNEEEQVIRQYAVSSLAKLGYKEAIPLIREVMQTIDSYTFKKKKDYYNLQLYSVAALAKLGDTEVLPRLEDALRSNNTQTRLKAIALMKELKDKRTIDILQYKMKYDQNEKVKKAAREALKEMGVAVPEEAVKPGKADTDVKKEEEKKETGDE